MNHRWNQIDAEPAGLIIMDGGMGSTLQARGAAVDNPLWSSAALLTESGRQLNDAVHRAFVEAGARLLITNTHNASVDACRAYLADRVRRETLEPDVVSALRGVPRKHEPEVLCRWLHTEAVKSVRRAAAPRSPEPTACRHRPAAAADSKRAKGRRFWAQGPKEPTVRVAGCLASPDHPYATHASLDSQEVERKIRPQVEILASEPLDLVLFEMMTTTSDLEGVKGASSELGIHMPFGVGLPCGPDGCTLGGVSMADAVQSLAPAGPAAYFVQCTSFPWVDKALSALVGALHVRSDKKPAHEEPSVIGSGVGVGVYANDGRKWTHGKWQGRATTPAEYAAAGRRWWAAGAEIIGGCCGIGPAHIRQLRQQTMPSLQWTKT